MKIPRSLVVALVLPVSVAAQQPSGTPPNPVTAAFRGRIITLHRNIAQAFDSIPATLFAYKPTPAQLSIGYIAQHLANDNYFFCSQFGGMKPTRPAADTTTADSIKATWPRETLIAKLKESSAFCESAFAQVDDAKLSDQVTVRFGGNSRNVVRASMLIGHAIDLADHYSQLANYMRLNNILPPTALPRGGRGG
jgi:hypothetical protein